MVRIFVILILCMFAMTSLALAGGAGNCVQPIKTTSKFIGVGGAFEYNYVHERMNHLDNKDGPRSMQVRKVNQVYGKAIIGLGDYVNLYGKAGGSNYELQFVDQAQNALMEIGLDDGVYAGGGINALFPITKVECVSLGVGFDIQGNFFLNDVNSITRAGQVANVSSGHSGGQFYGFDGQDSLYLTCRYDIEKMQTSLVPYIGGYHSWMMVGTSKGLTYTTRAAGYVDKKGYPAAFDVLSFGVLMGIDIDIAKYVNLNVEGRFVGETALTTGATIKF